MLFVGIFSLFLLIDCNPIYKTTSTRCLKSCPVLDDSRINIHLVPHSHDDVGWLQTVDGYYFGTAGERTYEHAGVQYIISSTVEALKQNRKRRFIQVETAYFWRWWQYQTEDTRQDFKNLINNGQIEIINGAWSMNDEACTNYQSLIDQFTYGFYILNETLGVCAQPTIGWQIDPFGHSREHASLLKQFGFDGLIIGRLDYRDKNNRKSMKSLDFLWRTSGNLDNNQLFASMFPDFYLSVNGFCFDITCTDQPLITDKNSPLYNIDEKIDQFSAIMDTYSEYYQTNNILIPMGGDFHFQAAEINFINIDRLIDGFENNTRFNVFYSTPSCYIGAVNQEINKNSFTLPEKNDDFFPYASDPNSFWAGYYTSRPTQKRFERIGNNLLQAIKQLSSLYVINTDDQLNANALIQLKEAMGIMQHHDAITGTEKQFVANDYARILTNAIKSIETTTTNIISNRLRKDQDIDQKLNLEFCLLANISVCEPSNSKQFMVAIYNPLGWILSHYIRLPVPDGFYKITGPDGDEIYDLVDSMSDFDYLPKDLKSSPKEIVFKASNLPPLGVKLYHIERIDNNRTKIHKNSSKSNNKHTFTIDSNTGLLQSITLNGKTVEISQEFLFYTASIGNNEVFKNRSSGAYIFRPNSTQPAKPMHKRIATEEFNGNLVQEIKQTISEEVSQIIRIYNDSDHVEFDWFVGDLQINNTGKEVITRYIVKNLTNNGEFYTDSNGREMIKRHLNQRLDYYYDPTIEPISGNYYPITSQITINDTMNQFTILVDRSEGGSSLANGTIELMLHRRLLHDDAFGVNEALNEQQYARGLYARGQHYLLFNTIESSSKTRILALKKLLQPIVLVGDANVKRYTLENLQNHFNFKFEGLKNPLPENVHLLTFEPWSNQNYLIRLEHVLEKINDPTGPITVNLQDIFPFTITNITETTLGANQFLKDFNQQPKFIWNSNYRERLNYEDVSLKISLKPMQIRTFIITIDNRI